jgi:hypothetical protein
VVIPCRVTSHFAVLLFSISLLAPIPRNPFPNIDSDVDSCTNVVCSSSQGFYNLPTGEVLLRRGLSSDVHFHLLKQVLCQDIPRSWTQFQEMMVFEKTLPRCLDINSSQERPDGCPPLIFKAACFCPMALYAFLIPQEPVHLHVTRLGLVMSCSAQIRSLGSNSFTTGDVPLRG